ncbi:MAG: hypothetical protein EOP00_33590 [Pedobacter sp.]|nr:MAG: hypothetical protein EOP00_33590 [Pedobacter sp.]
MKKNKSVVVLACLSLLYFPILEASASENINKGKNKVVLISLDGAGEKIINSVLLQDLMPNLKKIKQGGVHAAGSIPNYPSKTAPGHASIWTGTYGYKNGVTSNEIFKQPIDKYSVLDTERGFISTALQIEPIWITAIKQNKKVLITQSTHTYPFEPYFADKKFGIDGKDKLNILLCFEPKTLNKSNSLNLS